jgi:hypothetical protein
LLRGDAATASASAGSDALVRTDLSDSVPVFIDSDQLTAATDDLEPGVVTLAVPEDPNWKLTVDGDEVPSRRAFGETTGWDVTEAGVGELTYETSTGRVVLVLVNAVLWAVALLVAGRVRVPVSRRQVLVVDDDTVIDLTVEPLEPRSPATDDGEVEP